MITDRMEKTGRLSVKTKKQISRPQNEKARKNSSERTVLGVNIAGGDNSYNSGAPLDELVQGVTCLWGNE